MKMKDFKDLDVLYTNYQKIGERW